MPTLEFKGKPFVYSHHLSVPFRELIVDTKKSFPGGKKASLDDNLIIHGDNLEALKALLPRYAGKVNVIYIDPPYNTGDEGWAYNDNVNSPLMKEWLGKVVDRDDLERHDKWLCMMWPRLELLKELLNEKGVLLCSIDDVEVANLRLLMDEIFGESNFIAEMVWEGANKNDARQIGISHEYVIIYGRDRALLPREWNIRKEGVDEVLREVERLKEIHGDEYDAASEELAGWFRANKNKPAFANRRFRYIDERGVYKEDDPTAPGGRKIDLLNPKTGKLIPLRKNRGWAFDQDAFDELVKEGRISFVTPTTIMVRRYLHETEHLTPPSVFYQPARSASERLSGILGADAFEYPKDEVVLARLFAMASGPNALVLDSFAGSGTTAHAVLAQNQRDGGNRKFILIETEDYADSLTAERVRRVIKGVPSAKDEALKKGLGGSFTYCELGEPLDLKEFFEGKGTPSYEQVARYVIFTATGSSVPDVPKEPRDDWFAGEAGGMRVHLIYRPDLAFMRGNDAALSREMVKAIKKSAKGKPVLVFAAQKFMSQKELSAEGITFCQLPYAVYRILGATRMQLKTYQIEALDTLSGYLKLLSDAEAEAQQAKAAIAALPENMRAHIPAPKEPVITAWDTARETGVAASRDPWRALKDGAARQIPHVCLKLPTGGGKTLLAAHSLERISADLFKKTSGVVLWLVPNDAIYTQTKKQLTDRENPIRQVLDRLSGGRVKILEKLDGFTKQDLQDRLCVLLLMFPSANTKQAESRKVFRDSGHYETLFPLVDDIPANEVLLNEVPNLETVDLAEATQFTSAAGRIKHSLGNVLRMVQPIIVLDEGHHTYGELARKTLSTLNPRFILELTATPKREFSNILVNIPGLRLKDEEMIKLPIKLMADQNLAWKTVLQDALEKLNALQKDAEKSQGQTGRYIRPIMLVRVDLTGKEQRHKTGELIHSEDVFEYLTQVAGLPPEAVRRQTAELKELKDDDLLSDTCPVRAIITKDALREGWDCPFAYVLAVLSSGTAKTALTQMIGRVLRQPYATRTGEEALDSAYVFCKDVKVGDAVAHIKGGLEKEGMGDLASQIETGGGGADKTEAEIRIRKKFSGSRIMVPRVLHRDGKKYRELEFESDILPEIDFGAFSYRNAAKFAIADYNGGQRSAIDITFASGEKFAIETGATSIEIAEAEELDRPALVRRMLDVVPNPWQGMRILDDALADLGKRKDVTEEKILAARYQLIEDMLVDLREQVDEAAETTFRKKVKKGDIVFKLLASPFDDLNFEFEEVAHVRVSLDDTPLFRNVQDELERSLYSRVFKSQVNDYEKNVALYLDSNDAVHWWWRIVSRQGWSLQGWKRNKVYPDFLIKLEAHGDDARMLVLETKGKHLGGSEDTAFKKKLFEVLEAAYVEAGDVELFADRPGAMNFRIMLQEDNWKSDLQSLLTAQ